MWITINLRHLWLKTIKFTFLSLDFIFHFTIPKLTHGWSPHSATELPAWPFSSEVLGRILNTLPHHTFCVWNISKAITISVLLYSRASHDTSKPGKVIASISFVKPHMHGELQENESVYLRIESFNCVVKNSSYY